MEISITRALSELKLLDRRINNAITDSSFVITYKKNSNKVNNIDTPTEFSEKAKAYYQSVNDLIERRKVIKSAIVENNAKTLVVIGGVKMSRADAIERKESIQYEICLLASMEKQYNHALSVAQRNNEACQIKLDALLQTMYEKDTNGKIKGDINDIAITTKNFWEQNEYIVLDVLKLGDKIKTSKEDIDTFNAEVDFILSESNTLTKIEIPD